MTSSSGIIRNSYDHNSSNSRSTATHNMDDDTDFISPLSSEFTEATNDATLVLNHEQNHQVLPQQEQGIMRNAVANSTATSADTVTINTSEELPPSSWNALETSAWNKKHQYEIQQPVKVDFHSIVTQQEKEAKEALAASSTTSTRICTVMQDTKQPSEEELIRLAIEASLKEASVDNSMQTSTKFHQDDELDEDMKLAIALSLAQNKFPTKVEYKLNIYEQGTEAINPVDNQNKTEFLGKEKKSVDPIATDSSHAHHDGIFVPHHVASMPCSPKNYACNITWEEEEEIMKAILEADDREQAKSLKLAMELQEEENRLYEKMKINRIKSASSRSNIRTVTIGEFQEFGDVAQCVDESSEIGGHIRRLYSHADYDDHNEFYGREIMHQDHEDHYHQSSEEATAGYTINSSVPSKSWARINRNTIIGPNNEIRTKHDVTLKNQSNAERLLGGGGKSSSTSLASKDGKLSVSDTAYNSFHQSLKNSMKRSMVKGVERSGTGRAENYAEKTRGGAMDGNVRLLITKAINNGLIQHCNGVVKEGKEAVVYHADGGTESDGFDVAVKVFKRIQEFKNRSAYVDDDPRYHGTKFRNIDKRQQVEVWAEKEYRNLVRASRAGVAVPTPIMQKENVLFMRFLGEGGWPAAQLREIELKKQSKKWIVLYIQILVAIRRLYHCARLVHADLSEYNILVCPMSQVENALDKSEEAKHDLLIVLIDFGQAIERNHPSALDLLRRDLFLVNSFFSKQDVPTLQPDQCLDFILEEISYELDDDESNKFYIEYDQDTVEGGEEFKDEWRHNIKGWDDAKYMEKLERMLSEISINKGSVD